MLEQSLGLIQFCCPGPVTGLVWPWVSAFCFKSSLIIRGISKFDLLHLDNIMRLVWRMQIENNLFHNVRYIRLCFIPLTYTIHLCVVWSSSREGMYFEMFPTTSLCLILFLFWRQFWLLSNVLVFLLSPVKSILAFLETKYWDVDASPWSEFFMAALRLPCTLNTSADGLLPRSFLIAGWIRFCLSYKVLGSSSFEADNCRFSCCNKKLSEHNVSNVEVFEPSLSSLQYQLVASLLKQDLCRKFLQLPYTTSSQAPVCYLEPGTKNYGIFWRFFRKHTFLFFGQ